MRVGQGVLSLNWRCLPFGALAPLDLYRLLQLRTAVFVVEQHCVFQDMDNADPDCLHLLGTSGSAGSGGGALMAYARLVPAGLKYAEASIGRVITAQAARGTGLGHTLMQHALAELFAAWGVQPVRIGAQAHLQAFYGAHGFVPSGPVYLEDGIDHIEMVRPAAAG
jgi:ElaA protein